MKPSWLELRTGTFPIVLFAPHGGRRLAPRAPGRHKVNDLHTASLTRDLANRWNATAIVNESRDRNEIDLNRISEVRRDGCWLPALLAEVLDAMVRESGAATLLVIHGWNAVQTVCDVGMGVVERDGAYIAAGTGGCTASDDFIATKIAALRRRAQASDIMVTIGARYPAAHRNNLLQLFTAAYRDDEDANVRTLARLASDGRLAAAQLELGIPLRWPGRFQRAFAAALTEVFAPWVDGAGAREAPADIPTAPTAARSRRVGDGDGGPRTADATTVRDPDDDRLPIGIPADPVPSLCTRGIQFVARDLLGFASIDARDGASTAGRLLLSPSAGRLALFTGDLGDANGECWSVPRLRFVDEPSGSWRVRYDGPLLAFPTLTPFLDLEHGLARGELVDAAVDLAFRAASDVATPRRFGTIRGSIELGSARYDVTAGAVAHEQRMQAPRRLPFCRITLPDDDGGGTELWSTNVIGAANEQATAPPPAGGAPAARAAAPSGVEARFMFELAGTQDARGTVVPVSAACTLAIGTDGGRLTIGRIAGRDGPHPAAGDLEGACERLIPVRRPGRAGAVIHTIYALVRMPQRPPGWLELSIEQRS